MVCRCCRCGCDEIQDCEEIVDCQMVGLGKAEVTTRAQCLNCEQEYLMDSIYVDSGEFKIRPANGGNVQASHDAKSRLGFKPLVNLRRK